MVHACAAAVSAYGIVRRSACVGGNMKKYIYLILLILLVLIVPSLALAEGEDIPEETDYVYEYPAIEITPEPVITDIVIETPAPEPTPNMQVQGMENTASATPTSIPYYYEYDDTTLIGSLAAFLGIQQGEETPQNLGEAIPYILGITLVVGVLWFIYAMFRGFTGNVFGKARNGGR